MASTAQIRSLSELTCALPLALDRLLSLGIAGFGYASVRRWRSRIDGS